MKKKISLALNVLALLSFGVMYTIVSRPELFPTNKIPILLFLFILNVACFIVCHHNVTRVTAATLPTVVLNGGVMFLCSSMLWGTIIPVILIIIACIVWQVIAICIENKNE